MAARTTNNDADPGQEDQAGTHVRRPNPPFQEVDVVIA
jgi:hypothetical protein